MSQIEAGESNNSKIRSLRIQTPRLDFHCRTLGDPENMPVLLIHSSFATGRWWEPFMKLLGEGFYLVAPDLRGCGETVSPAEADLPPGLEDEAYAIEAQAADIGALVDALGWEEFDLVGHSAGGAIAIEYALTHLDKLRTLTLVDSAPIEGAFTPTDMLMLLSQMRTDHELLANALAALMPTYPTAQEAFAHLVADATKMAPAAYTAVAEALNRWNRFADAHQLTLPTLLVWGELDTVVDRDTTTRMLIAIPGANNLDVIRNVGHCPMLESPVALAERFIEFVTDDLDEFAQVRRDAL